MTYDPAAVETKWQARWAERRTNELRSRPGRTALLQPDDVPAISSAEEAHIGNFTHSPVRTSTAGSCG
ncbi:MAG: hypothetical protein R2882_13625 [Gemmatimonadales bacterium]